LIEAAKPLAAKYSNAKSLAEEEPFDEGLMAARWFVWFAFGSPSSSIAVFCSGVVAVGVRWWMPAASAIYERNKDRTERERGPFCRRKCIRTNESAQINH
jgi:hypothetical protein